VADDTFHLRVNACSTVYEAAALESNGLIM